MFRTRLPQRRRGAVVILVAVCLTVLIMVVALTVDAAMLMSSKRFAQAAADAGALAGASTIFSRVSDNHDSNGKVVVFCTDIEHGKRLDPKIVEFARGADILIHEGQYTPEELETHRGWGHSSWEQAVQVAEEAQVQRLVITHHDPDHDDACLLDIEQQCKVRHPGTVLAREGMEIAI